MTYGNVSSTVSGSGTLGDKTVERTRLHNAVDLSLDMRAGDVLTLTVVRAGAQTSVEITVTADCIEAY